MSNVFHLEDFRKKPSDSESQSQLRSRLLKAVEELRQNLLARRAPSPSENLLSASTPILLYQVSWGRNAWNSTWIKRYARNTLCRSWSESNRFVEKRLKQGTSFRMLITPGWHLQFDRKAYLVCEINTSLPFSRLVEASFNQEGMSEFDCLESLSPKSDIWTGSVPKHDSIIVQQTPRAAKDFVAWSDRTSEKGKTRTPGHYLRVISDSSWFFAPVDSKPLVTFDTSHFATHVLEIVK